MLDRERPITHPLCAALATSALLLAAPGLSSTAHACGGFWCSLDAPVDQTAEQIIFVDDEGDTMTAIIQIAYRGPSEKFAWVIPIPGDPTISVSSNTAFERLAAATAPTYELDRTVVGTCMADPDEGGFADGGVLYRGALDAGSSEPHSPVIVIDQGSVGPYDYATIAVDDSAREPAQAALDWFTLNGYDLTGVDADVLGPYLADGLNLLAFKLTKAAEQEVGTIRPVVLTYQGDAPSIPIRPTAVAAEDDMGILVWVVAAARAVPENYKSLVLNEALIDWFNPRYTYDAVVTRAADEAGGQGFVTELAGPSKAPADAVFTTNEADGLASLEAATYVDGLDAIWGATRWFREWDGWRDAVAAGVVLPDGVSLDDFARDPESYRDTAQVDAARFLKALRDEVVTPVLETQRLLASRPELTRLYTTMSADEMTIDPAFTFNADLPDVSNHHVARQTVECDASVTEREAPWRIELPQGDVVHGAGYTWPVDASMVPANRRIEQLSNTGEGEVLEDRSADIAAVLHALPAGAPAADAATADATREPRGASEMAAASDARSSCAARRPGPRSEASLVALPLLWALLLARSARRRGSR